MRTNVLWLAALLLVPLAAAHGGGAHHVTPFTAVLLPGLPLDVPMEFEQGPLYAGWMLIVVTETVFSNGTSPTALLIGPGGPGVSWTLPASGGLRYTTAVPATGQYTLRLTHPSSTDTVQVRLYFDQSCSCSGKVLLADFDHAMVVFNYDLTAGQRVQVLLNEPRAAETRVTLATRPGSGASWPADFEALEVSEYATMVPTGPGSVGVHQFVFTANEARTYYFVVEAKRYVDANDTGPESLLIVPEIHTLPAEERPPEGSPLLLPLVAGVGIGIAVLTWALLRARDKPLKEDPLPRRRRRR